MPRQITFSSLPRVHTDIHQPIPHQMNSQAYILEEYLRRQRAEGHSSSERRCDEFGFPLGRARSPYPRGRRARSTCVSWTSSDTASDEDDTTNNGFGSKLERVPTPYPKTNVSWADSVEETGHKLERVPTPYPRDSKEDCNGKGGGGRSGVKGCFKRVCGRLFGKKGENELHRCPGIGIWEGSTVEDGLNLEDVMKWRQGVLNARGEEDGRVEEVVQRMMNGSRGRF